VTSPGLFSLMCRTEQVPPVLRFHCDRAAGTVISAWVSNPLPPNSSPLCCPGEMAVGTGLLTELNDDHSPPAFLKAQQMVHILCTEKDIFVQCLQKFRQEKCSEQRCFSAAEQNRCDSPYFCQAFLHKCKQENHLSCTGERSWAA